MSHFSVLVLHSEEQSVEDMLLPYMENCCGQPPFEYMEFYEDEDCEIDNITGKRGYWQNPDAKWDWYVIGGRWAGLLKAKEGIRYEPEGRYKKGYFDEAKLGDCDFSLDEKEYQVFLQQWEEKIDTDTQEEAFEFWPLGREGIKKRYGNKEQYAKNMASFCTRAVVTPDGEWHEEGEMLWWGISSESDVDALNWQKTYYERFLKEADPNFIATVVDCHI